LRRLVNSALDELPIESQRALEHAAIAVSDRGAENHAYSIYVGAKRAGTPFFRGGGLPDEIPILRDTLVRDLGNDPERLRLHVVQTFRRCVTGLVTTSASTRQAFANSDPDGEMAPRACANIRSAGLGRPAGPKAEN
jgi:hypothetical protein